MLASIPSIARRLTLLLALIATTVFTLAGLLLDQAVVMQLAEQEQQTLDSKLGFVRHLLREVRAEADLRELDHRLSDVIASEPSIRIWVVGSGNVPIFGGQPRIEEMDRQTLLVRREDGVALHGRRIRSAESPFLGPVDVVIGVDGRDWLKVLAHHRATLLLVCGAGIVIVVVLGSWATRHGLSAVRKLSAQATRITPGALSLRLPLEGTPRELRELAIAFNDVLDRLSEAYEQLEAFNADVAHELRTPLANLISGSQVALASERATNGELRETLASNLEELELLRAMVNDMLFLARADRGERVGDRVEVALEEEAAHVAEYFEAALDERNVRLKIEGHARALVDRPLVRRAIANLVSNALRYTPPGEAIRLSIVPTQWEVKVVVANPGPEVPPEQLPRIFDRFFRGDASRRGDTEGLGLGLAIVRAIARMHRGTTFASSTGGRTEIGFSVATAA